MERKGKKGKCDFLFMVRPGREFLSLSLSPFFLMARTPVPLYFFFLSRPFHFFNLVLGPF